MSKVAYYMRTSHYLQNIDTQLDKVEEGWKVYKDEGISGRIYFADRPAGKKLLEDLAKGKVDSVITLRLDRLGRDTADILNTIKLIHGYGVPITSKNEGITTLIDGKETPMTNLLINILSGLAEFQYHQTREKVLDGINLAKSQNKYKGRRVGATESLEKLMSKPKVKKIKELLDANVGIRAIARTVNCSANYIYKVKSYYETV